MLCTAPDNQIFPGATINVTQIVTLVEELVQRPADKDWLHDRIATAHLNQHEVRALIAMHERLQEQNLVLSLSSDGYIPWEE